MAAERDDGIRIVVLGNCVGVVPVFGGFGATALNTQKGYVWNISGNSVVWGWT
jgi:hypothetical protein